MIELGIVAGIFLLIGGLIWGLTRKATAAERSKRERSEADHAALEKAAQRQARPIPRGRDLLERMRARRERK